MNTTKQLALFQLILDVVTIIAFIVLIVNLTSNIDSPNTPDVPIGSIVFLVICLVIKFILGIIQIIYSLNTKDSSPLGLASGICAVIGIFVICFILNIIILCTNIKFSELTSNNNTVVINQPTTPVNNSPKTTIFVVHGLKFDSYIQAKEYCNDKNLSLSNIIAKE